MTHATYRKTKDGEWVVCGPADSIHPDAAVTVHLKDGRTKTEQITLVGKPFTVDGERLVYGHIAVRPRTARPAGDQKPRCAECHRNAGVVEAADSSGIVDLVCHRCARLTTYERSYC